MSDNSNQTDVSATENDDFPLDYTEYYYRCKISDVENGSKRFYYAVNTIIHNYEKIADSEKFVINRQNWKVDLSEYSFINQLVKYNNDFYKVSQNLILKENINSKEEYRNNLNLLLRILNETILHISAYYTYKNKKVGKLKLNKLTLQSGSEYKEYDISDIRRECQFEEDIEIKFKEILNEISSISYIIGSDDFNAIIDSVLFNFMIVILYTICTILFFIIILALIALICGLLYINKIDVLFLLEYSTIYYVISAILAFISCEIFWSPIRSNIERRKKSYNQSKDYVINLKNKKKIKWSAVWSLIREIILSRFGSND